ncbi:toxin-antitoxin system HicB family antitoxin [Salmonella enterica subsp. enterica serovar Ohio]|nr:toxin-antitoxin system HicB family antitoxin [Salmonella enterica]EBK9109075.1 toxin-antitoxin system HicB family antitoxin [Salmonella enterica]EDW9601656.1 toxin-antitoxin system HicB family antitoxin [Salmonella enterica subsp. enterica serovar Ohio]EGJ2909172.1 toxin-antitoxin system HicB family antitoxin [Salmonella enterica subsp. enterica serovar Thompson]EJZ3357901.1 toxin-antitoxin system HicB family antitoxin [Salmonella enterica]
MSSLKRDSYTKGSGKAPAFNVRIPPDLKEQFEEAAKSDGVSLGNWLKESGRKELKRKGIEPKG